MVHPASPSQGHTNNTDNLHSHSYTWGQFSVISLPNMCVSGLWEITGERRENPRVHMEKMLTSHRKAWSQEAILTFSLRGDSSNHCLAFHCQNLMVTIIVRTKLWWSWVSLGGVSLVRGGCEWAAFLREGCDAQTHSPVISVLNVFKTSGTNLISK